MTTTYKTEVRHIGDCRCGESVRTLGSGSPFDYAYRPSVGADKYAPGVTIPGNATTFWERSAVGTAQLCPPIRATAQNLSHSKYTVSDWQQTNFDNLNTSEGKRVVGEQVRSDSLRIMRDTDCVVTYGQKESTQRLGERIGDVNYWRHEVVHELEMNVAETEKLEETKRQAECLLREVENPLRIVQECLYARQQRMGIDQVHDDVEVGLNREIDVIKSIQERLCRLLERIAQALKELADARQCLERDSLDKFSALHIDRYAHGLNNTSPGIALYPGIEKSDRTMSTPESWIDYTIRLVQRSQNARAESSRLRAEAKNLINTSINELWQAWNNTNQALKQRVQQTQDAKNKIQVELSRLIQEIADQEKYRQALQKALADKCPPLKVAHTRLERRTHRPCMELCRDNAMLRLQSEVGDIYGSIEQLKQKLADTEAAIAALLEQKHDMEDELRIKANTLLIDRERVLGSRRAFPIGSLITKCI
ncbi:tektin-3-like [Pollicipes pollicipes]|uniref:tektin-3-like n=1 Tax=Pollicipes pollicipes TaxID=41117 RepID=UPI001884F5BA|nr:tektin-3-like [Pollicipes pollicipes]